MSLRFTFLLAHFAELTFCSWDDEFSRDGCTATAQCPDEWSNTIPSSGDRAADVAPKTSARESFFSTAGGSGCAHYRSDVYIAGPNWKGRFLNRRRERPQT